MEPNTNELSVGEARDKSLTVNQLRQHAAHLLIPLLSEPSDDFKGILQDLVSELKAVPAIVHIAAVRAMVDFFEDDRYTFADTAGLASSGNVKFPLDVRTIRTDRQTLLEYLQRRGRLEDMLLDAGVIQERFVEEPRPVFDFRAGDEIGLSNLEAGDRVALVDYKGREIHMQTRAGFRSNSKARLLEARGTDAHALQPAIGREFSLSVYHPADEAMVRLGIPASTFEREEIRCVPPGADQRNGKYAESYAGRLIFQDETGEPALRLRLASVTIDPEDHRERLRMEAIRQRIEAANSTIISGVQFEPGTHFGRIRAGGYQLKLRKEGENIQAVRWYEEGTNSYSEYTIDENSAIKMMYGKAGSGWVAWPGIGEDGRPAYGEGEGIPVPLSDVAMLLEKVAKLVSLSVSFK
ncbi:hypothetical protein HY468_04490 [Candidatus Roizmanbacteria bacterium]|nr:hypothetical protein [Candidatus Roizmanbacteria bacterium]